MSHPNFASLVVGSGGGSDLTPSERLRVHLLGTVQIAPFVAGVLTATYWERNSASSVCLLLGMLGTISLVWLLRSKVPPTQIEVSR